MVKNSWHIILNAIQLNKGDASVLSLPKGTTDQSEMTKENKEKKEKKNYGKSNLQKPKIWKVVHFR